MDMVAALFDRWSDLWQRTVTFDSKVSLTF